MRNRKDSIRKQNARYKAVFADVAGFNKTNPAITTEIPRFYKNARTLNAERKEAEKNRLRQIAQAAIFEDERTKTA